MNKTNQELNTQLTQAQKEIEDLNKYIDELLNQTPVNTVIIIKPVSASVGSLATLTAYVNDINGGKVTGGRVIFKVNGKTLRDKNNNTIYGLVTNGTAKIKYKVESV